MPITYANAKINVARVLGNSSYTDELSNAGDAISEALQEWNLRNDWKFLLMDTRNGFTVAACTSDGADPSVVTTTTTDGFAGVNVGQDVTGFSAASVVASVDSTSQITLTTQVTGGPVTATFTGEIPIRAGVSVYNLPSPIKRPYTARLNSPTNKVMMWRDWREIDRKFGDIVQQGEPAFYTVYNPDSYSTSSQNGKIEVFPTPDSAHVMRMRYFRPINDVTSDGTNLDIPDKYMYALLERAKFYYLKNKDSENVRTQEVHQLSEGLLIRAIRDDRARSGDRDERMVPFVEWGYIRQVDNDDVVIVDW
jgi:hypothetical protein